MSEGNSKFLTLAGSRCRPLARACGGRSGPGPAWRFWGKNSPDESRAVMMQTDCSSSTNYLDLLTHPGRSRWVITTVITDLCVKLLFGSLEPRLLRSQLQASDSSTCDRLTRLTTADFQSVLIMTLPLPVCLSVCPSLPALV